MKADLRLHAAAYVANMLSRLAALQPVRAEVDIAAHAFHVADAVIAFGRPATFTTHGHAIGRA